jgi:acyl dehydratase
MTVTDPQASSVTARNLAPDSDNKIHDDDVARRFGFTGALVPGVEVFAYAVHPFVEAWGLGFLDRGTLQIRFRRPVYDGDLVTVTAQRSAGHAYALTLTGTDGEVRAVGQAAPESDDDLDTATVDRTSFPEAEVPASPPVADSESLAPGTTLGTIVEVADPTGCADYLAGIGETSAAYKEQGIVHPGLLLRMVNASLFRSVTMGPWIHTESSCRFLGRAPVGSTLSSRGVVTGLSSRKGNDYVHYDALVCADERAVLAVAHTAIYSLAG